MPELELEPELDEPPPVELDESPSPELLEVEASSMQNPSTGLQRRPSQHASSSRQPRARSPTATQVATHVAGPSVAVPGS